MRKVLNIRKTQLRETELNQTKISLLDRIGNEIKRDKFSFENVMKRGVYYGQRCNVLPLFCSYGCIGYVVDTDDGKLTWDFELNKLEIERVA